MNLGDLVEYWTLVGAEQDLVAAKHRDTQLGFALLLKFYGRFGRFPRGRAELHDDVVEFVAGSTSSPATGGTNPGRADTRVGTAQGRSLVLCAPDVLTGRD